jgi:pilus assembly protein Flp/PilA
MVSRILSGWNVLVKLHGDESGQDLIEYALIAALIALGAVVGMDTVANEINSAFNIISQKLSNAVS